MCVCEAASDHGPVGAELGNVDSVFAYTRVIRSAAFRQDIQMIPMKHRGKNKGAEEESGARDAAEGADLLSNKLGLHPAWLKIT